MPCGLEIVLLLLRIHFWWIKADNSSRKTGLHSHICVQCGAKVDGFPALWNAHNESSHGNGVVFFGLMCMIHAYARIAYVYVVGEILFMQFNAAATLHRCASELQGWTELNVVQLPWKSFAHVAFSRFNYSHLHSTHRCAIICSVYRLMGHRHGQ